jgi:PAS domain S-box-containing protein
VAVSAAALVLVGWATAPDAHHPVWWPSAGLAFLVLRRRTARPVRGLLVGTAAGVLASTFALHHSASLALGEAAGDLLGALGGGALLAQLPRRGSFGSPRRTLTGWAVSCAVALAGTLTSLLPHLLEGADGFGVDFAQRFLARLCGVVAVAPLAMAASAGWREHGRRLEALVLAPLLVVTSVAAFSVAPGGAQVALVFAVFLPLVAAGLRLPSPGPQVAVFFVSAVAVVASRADTGLFGPAGMEPALQVFLVFVALTTQLVASVTAEREHAFAALAQSEQRFRLMTENGRDLVCLHGPDGNFRTVSASSSSILGREPEELVGQHLHTYVHAGDVLSLEQLLARANASGEPELLRFRFRRQDGTWAWLEMTVQRVLDEAGRPSLQSATRDVSARVRDSEGLRMACQSAGILVFSWDLAHNRMMDEGRFVELYGVDVAAQTDPLQAMLRCVHPEDRASAREALEEALAGRAGYRTRFRVLHPSRGERHLFACGEVERDGAGRPVSMVGVNWDVTDQVRVEDELRAAKESAENATRAKATFLATMSHEIRTPLNGIIGMTDALLPDVDRGNRNAVETIRRSGEVLLAVLNDILDFSKIEAGKLELEQRVCDLEQLLGDLAALFARLTREKGLHLKVAVAPDVGQLVCDPLRLRQVLSNLVSNAVKFTAQGTVSVSCHRLPADAKHPLGAVALEVSDTGIGIPADKVDRLFKEFSQVDASTTRRYGGTGLGLAISRRLVEAMGGAISVRSEAGRGSTFSVVLPLPTAEQLATVQAAEPPRDAPVLDASSLRGVRVLLAEDNAINRRVAVALLGKMGVEVHAVENGRLALEAWRRGGWDLIIMDMQMPELDGLEATRAIRAAEAAGALQTIPILAMTANASPEDRRLCLQAGMDEVVTKPATRASLQSALVRALTPATARRASA